MITSRSNPKIKLVRELRQRKARQTSGLFIVEGIHHVGEAIESGAKIEAIYYAPDLLTSDFARRLLAAQSAKGIPCHTISAEVFASIADKDNPQGILAIVKRQRWDLKNLNAANFPWGVALISPQDPGNLGAILRTVDAVGASGLLLLDSSVDPTHPSAVRASMGALFWYPIVETSFTTFVNWVKQEGYQVYATSAHGEQDYRQAEYCRPCLLLLGSERQGLSPEQRQTVIQAGWQLLRIPMQGRVSSLNLAVAAGVLLYEMRHRLTPHTPSSLNTTQKPAGMPAAAQES